MIEIPEAVTITRQINETLTGKKITKVIANSSPHKFAWFYEDPKDYPKRLMGKTIEKANVYGSFVEVKLGITKLLLGDGVNFKYIKAGEKLPKKHQLLLEFDDNTVLTAGVQMYGGLWCYEDGEFDNQYLEIARQKPSPLSDKFDYEYFTALISDEALQKKSIKAVLATEQRIPGFGNGVLQDILFNAKIHPKRKFVSLDEKEIKILYNSIKTTLHDMTMKNGRDTEKDLFGNLGNYKTKLSKKTVKEPCKLCGGKIIKKAYLGGSIYYCEQCQKEH
ncbi:DNA-formamidopyrimidine glycosylase family protein [Abyssisolibacter fermentans]|uniref:DNA-formamidopyrimidine glycosylase family protein n=1 Tax=Abyssisolibacter fermentans TaxID=1766203 RepID=UPI00082C5B20|nr:DNA-formamidopyrimidine glycosylase family protein [Abyssisolibacter fermentans]